MRITFSPDGVEPVTWDFQPDKLLMSEAAAIEKVTGLGFTDWLGSLGTLSGDSMRALVWVLSKRTDPTLRFSAVDFPVGALAMEADEDELAEQLEQDGPGNDSPPTPGSAPAGP